MLSLIVAFAVNAAPCQRLQDAALTACLEAEVRQIVALDLAGSYPGTPCIEYRGEALRQCYAIWRRVNDAALQREAEQEAAVRRGFEERAREAERRAQERERRELEEREAARRAAADAEARTAWHRAPAPTRAPPQAVRRTVVRQTSTSDRVTVELRAGASRDTVTGRPCGLAETGLGSCPAGSRCRLVSQSSGVCERN